MKEKILAFLKSLLNKKEVEFKEDELETQIDELLKDNSGDLDLSKLDLSKLNFGDSKLEENNPLIKAILDQNKILTQSVKDLKDALGDERKSREEAVKAAQDEADKKHKQKIADRLKKAIDDKVITEGEKEDWQKKLEKDYDMANDFLDKMNPKKQFEKKDSSKKDDDKNTNDHETNMESARSLLAQSFNTDER